MLQLVGDLGPCEPAAQGCMRDAVVARKLSERLAGRASAHEREVGHEADVVPAAQAPSLRDSA